MRVRYVLHIHEEQECAATPGGFAGRIFPQNSRSAELALDPELPNADGNLGVFVTDDYGDASLDLAETTPSLGSDARSVTNRSIVVHRASKESRGAPVLRPGETLACGTIWSMLTAEYVRRRRHETGTREPRHMLPKRGVRATCLLTK
jgi:Cu/Zn superoxide dismutase